jgi:osmotically-inducible protein OsmY
MKGRENDDIEKISNCSDLGRTGPARDGAGKKPAKTEYPRPAGSENSDSEATRERKVSANVEDGIVTLSGTVELFIDKENAEKRVRKVKNVDGVRNHVQIAGKQVSDAELRETLANKLRYDRVGYGVVFNNLTVGVENGAVTIGGKVRDYPDRSSAIAIVETTPGVKDVSDEIDVAPVSIFDDELRVRLARAIYGHSGLQKYALDPQAPIRIVVENGRVELAGVVLNKGDRQIAYSQASSVPGVFSVENKLMVASEVTD